MIANTFVVPELNDGYKTRHVNLAEFLNLLVVFGDSKLPLEDISVWRVILEFCFKNLFSNFFKRSFNKI